MPFKYESMQHRIIANSVPMPGPLATECWIWLGARNGAYGKLMTRFKRGPRKGQVKTCFAHRESFKAFKNKRLVPKSPVRHTCDTPMCVNPDHLIGNSTYKANNRDTVKRGRHANMYGPTGKGKS